MAKDNVGVGFHNIVKFEKLYNKAIDDKQDTFEFEGTEVLVSYAKYVIEALNNAK